MVQLKFRLGVICAESVNNVSFHYPCVIPLYRYCLIFIKIFAGVDMINWEETKERLKQKISTLTDDKLFFVREKHEELLNRLEAKLGQTREAIIKIISNL